MLSRQEGSTTRHLASAQHWTGLAGGDTGRLFLTFGGPVCADRISYCPLDRVLTYKNLIYLLNLQFYFHLLMKSCRKGLKINNYMLFVVNKRAPENYYRTRVYIKTRPHLGSRVPCLTPN